MAFSLFVESVGAFIGLAVVAGQIIAVQDALPVGNQQQDNKCAAK
jgi:hypothetical protein